ncbi:MAG: DUF433 domain-containing protein [Nitrosomonas sp.]|nr:DUF433 domain-containing protein [Nitrosomonas sp.]
MAGVNNLQRWKGRIVTNPEILSGKPIVSGTRISVELILDHLAANWSMAEIIENYPGITQEDIWAALAFAADVMRIKPFIKVADIEEIYSDGSTD